MSHQRFSGSLSEEKTPSFGQNHPDSNSKGGPEIKAEPHREQREENRRMNEDKEEGKCRLEKAVELWGGERTHRFISGHKDHLNQITGLRECFLFHFPAPSPKMASFHSSK